MTGFPQRTPTNHLHSIMRQQQPIKRIQTKTQPLQVAPCTAAIHLTLPPQAVPEQDFEVLVGGQIINVRCPTRFQAGQTVVIRMQAHPLAAQHPEETPGLRRLYTKDPASTVYVVPVPEGVEPGQTFPVKIQGQPEFPVRIPPDYQPGMLIRFKPPPLTAALVREEYGVAEIQNE